MNSSMNSRPQPRLTASISSSAPLAPPRPPPAPGRSRSSRLNMAGCPAAISAGSAGGDSRAAAKPSIERAPAVMACAAAVLCFAGTTRRVAFVIRARLSRHERRNKSRSSGEPMLLSIKRCCTTAKESTVLRPASPRHENSLSTTRNCASSARLALDLWRELSIDAIAFLRSESVMPEFLKKKSILWASIVLSGLLIVKSSKYVRNVMSEFSI